MQERLRSLDAGLRQLAERLQAPDLDPADRATLERERGLRFQEREMFNRERRHTVQQRNEDLNKAMMLRMRRILEEIRGIVAEKADQAGFDLVFDAEGLNSSQVPFLMYARDAVDITPVILKELNQDVPPKD